MVAKLRSCCRIAAPVGASAAWPTSEEPARMATPRAAQNGTFQRVSRRSREDVIGSSHDSTAYDGRREAPRDLRAGRARVGAWGTRPSTAEAMCADGFPAEGRRDQGRAAGAHGRRVTRAWPTSGTYGQRLLDWCCMPTGRVLPSDRQAP